MQLALALVGGLAMYAVALNEEQRRARDLELLLPTGWSILCSRQ